MRKLLLFIFSIIFSQAVFSQQKPDHKIQGDLSFKDKKYAEAQKNYTLAIDSDDMEIDTLAKLYFMRAMCYTKLNNLANAINDYTSAIDYKHNYTDAYFNRGSAYENLNQFTNSISNYRKCITLTNANDHNKLKVIYNSLGYTYFRIHEVDSAFAYNVDAIQEDTQWPNAFYTRGFMFEYLKKYPEAIEALDNAIAKTSDNDTLLLKLCYMARANSKRFNNEVKSGIRDYDEVIKIEHDNKEANWNRAYCYHQLKEYKSAIKGYTYTMTLFKGDDKQLALLHNARGDNELGDNQFSNAITDYSASISLNPDGEPVYVNLGHAYIENGDYAIGIAKCKIALAFTSNSKYENSRIYSLMGEGEYKLKEDMQAITDLNKSIDFDPANYYSYYLRAIVNLNHLNNKDQAAVDFNKVIDLDTSRKSYDYIFALFFTGKQKLAITILQEMLSGTTNDVTACYQHYSLACLYALSNDEENANLNLQSALKSGYPVKKAIADENLDNIRNTDEYKRLISNYE
jgi:tetratricopeptide (TPR) repeat protein